LLFFYVECLELNANTGRINIIVNLVVEKVFVNMINIKIFVENVEEMPFVNMI